ncbi:MAG TPA: hypothetical protein DEB07_03310 [Candidatus Moranbacteria bacterium]|nr:hypothetical protein [Candidatus Moranbacteria bacterium]HBU25236.1 hypothetical protein [Candidatus Moranbacteria bacterium]
MKLENVLFQLRFKRLDIFLFYLSDFEIVPSRKKIFRRNYFLKNIFINLHNNKPMEEFDIPIFKKIYELYRNFYSFRNSVPKQDRYTLWQKCENILLETLESILLASQMSKVEKLPVLEKASLKLNLFRIFVRLAKEVKAIDSKKYVLLQEKTDEIGRMLGGWIKSVKDC